MGRGISDRRTPRATDESGAAGRANARRPIAVGLVGPLPPPSGGMANQTRQLARLLREAGLVVEIVQVNRPYAPAWIERVSGVRALFRLLPYAARLWRCAGRVDVFHVMANSGWAWHLFAAPAVWIARLRGVPAVVNYRGGELAAFLERQIRWVRPTLARAAAIVVPSGFLQEVFARWRVRAEIVPNIIDLSRFAPGSRDPAALDVLVSRNLEDIYDIATAIEAFAAIRALHPQARLTIAGSGPRRADLEALCAKLALGAAVRFTGRVDNEQMPDLYRSADVLLNPSLVDNMPISLLEAMASGTPIVTTNVGGIPFLVEDGRTALLVEPRQPQAMAAAVLRLIDDPALATRLSDAGLAAARNYTWPKVRPRLFDVYARAIGRSVEGRDA
ncbi:MAG: glycosyltransferase family 4 protein [Aromatoleum sp.]|nr:glycosyltransferase family 4 protein [Aromatoleum sp.]